jgi:hypothetical protein
MTGRYVEAGDGYDWIEDPIPAPGLSLPSTTPNVNTSIGGVNVSAPSSVNANLATNPAYLNLLASSGETGMTAQEAQGFLAPETKDIGNGMFAQYSPVTGELQGFTNASKTGGSYDLNGNFLPFQNEGWSLGGFLGGALSGVEDLATSDAVKTLAPMVLSGGLGGPAGVGKMLGTNALVGGAALGAGTAALTGQDIIKGAFTGGISAGGQNLAGDFGTFLGAGKDFAPILGGSLIGAGTAALTGQNVAQNALLGGLTNAGGVKLGDTGVSLGQVGAAAKVLDNIENGNLLAAVTGATNLAGAGNTQIGGTGLTVNDLAKDINLAKAVISGNPQLVSNALFSVANSAAQADGNTSKAMGPYFQTGAGTGVLPTDYATNDVGTQQLIDALTNAQTITGPSVQLASSDPNAALAALQSEVTGEAGRIGGAGSGTFVDSLGRMHVIDEGEDLETEKARTEAAITADQTGPGNQTVVNQADQQAGLDDLAAQLQDYESTALGDGPDVPQQLQDAGLTTPEEDQVNVDAQTQNLLAELAGSGVTEGVATPQEQPNIFTEQPAITEPFVFPELGGNLFDTQQLLGDGLTGADVGPMPLDDFEQPVITDTPEDLLSQATQDQQVSAEEDQIAADLRTQDLIDEIVAGQGNVAEQDLLNLVGTTEDGEGEVSPTETDVQDYIDSHILDDGADATDVSPTETDVQDYIDSHILDDAATTEGGTELTEQDVLDFIANRPEEEDIPEIVITAPRPEEEAEPGWETWQPPVEEDIPEIVITAPKEPTPPVVKPPVVTPPVVTPPVVTPPTPAKQVVAAAPTGYMPGVGDVARIKWENGLFGILPWNESPDEDKEAGQETSKSDDLLAALEDSQYATGGHVDDFSVEALLQILRS